MGGRRVRVPVVFLSVVVFAVGLPSVERASSAPFTHWTQQSPSVSPPARYGASIVYDRARSDVVLFGGYDGGTQLSDTWVWDGASWTETHPNVRPPARVYASMAYDSATDDAVLFGGFDRNGTRLSDTWVWNGSTWAQRFPDVQPPARYGASTAYDPATNDVVLFGGFSAGGTELSDTWLWNGARWTPKPPDANPVAVSARAYASMTYDPATNNLVMFGGYKSGARLSDTWVWNGRTWKKQVVAAPPPKRYGAAMAYDRLSNRVLLFGGYDSTGLSDTWSWNGAKWTSLAQDRHPSARVYASMIYDPAIDDVVLFAGFDNSGTPLSDTWAWNGETSLKAPPKGCDDTAAPLDASGNPVLPANATDVTSTDVDNQSDGSVDQLYPGQDTTTDLWYPHTPCDWSVGGTLPPGDQLVPSASAPCPGDVADPADDPGASTPPAPCPGAAEALAQVDPNITLAQLQTQLGQISTDQEANFAPIETGTALTTICKSRSAAKCLVPSKGAPPLNKALPFGGRDIIFVHGFETEPFKNVASGALVPKWPGNPNAFYDPTGYWKAQANGYWRKHILQYLHGSYGNNRNSPPLTDATNRYMTVAWPTTQRLFVGAHAMLTQIAQAMTTGVGPAGQPLVINNTGSGGVLGFCENGCVIISHSAGGPLTDVAMDLAKRTTVAGTYQNLYGNLGLLLARIRAHIALQGAFAGSGLATAAFLVEILAPVASACNLVIAIVDLFGPNVSDCSGLSSLIATIPRSSLLDLIPEVMQLRWGQWIDDTPIKTLTVAGGNPHADGIDSGFALGIPEAVPIRPLVKWLLLPGLDDGVLAMNGQCANPNLAGLETTSLRQASTYIPYSPLFPVKTFDMGVPLDRSISFWISQNVDRTLTLPSVPVDVPRPVSEGCTPYVAPDGMVQPAGFVSPVGFKVNGIILGGTNPLNRFTNHFSFLQSVSDHYVGPLNNAQEGSGPYYRTACYLASGWFTFNHNCQNSRNDNTEEVRTPTNATVYSAACPGGTPQCASLVNPSFRAAGMVQQFTRGKSISFRLFGRRHRWWIWKRTYHLLRNSQAWQENDYVFTYLLR